MIPKALKTLLQRADPVAVETLQRKVAELEQELLQVRGHFQVAAGAQSSYARRASALRQDHPQIWERYFTKTGEAERAKEVAPQC